MKEILIFLRDILSQPAILLGIVSFVGLTALRKPRHKILIGTLGPILGYIMLGVGAEFIVMNLEPLGKMIEKGFNIKGVVPNNEAVVAAAQNLLGKETMLILVVGLFINLMVAKFTKYKYIFLTGHHSFYMACLLSAVLGAMGFSNILLIFIGGFFLGTWSAISPAIGQKYTLKVTDGEEIAMGHFGSLGYYISAWIGKKVGDVENTTENMKIPEKWGFLRNTTIATAITMTMFYLIAGIVAGNTYVETLSNGISPYLYLIMLGLKFSVGVAIVYNGVRMILADLIPAFQGIATKIIPDSIPAVDCAVFFTFAQTAVIIGFIFSFIGGIVGMLILGISGGILIIPGLVPHFFCGATAGIYGNSTGGKRGAVIGSFVNGLLLSFLPAALLPVLGKLGFVNTTFGDVDFTLIGILLGMVNSFSGHSGIYLIMIIITIVLIIPNFLKIKSKVINNS
ncbi:PTS ascorbate transporter subunit IIC [Leptotrichia sp. OH3620_COT-345]|uniref:PTS ascorbate transporter subunit IIC n=1 Tax=Leptotrichia sp. OH3620_COT-345 TaxID=2491048 RepID=UPI000F64C8FA|nr:PTS ascorbate transporter subunit IIC [Leptotrichia sp. OH3620_COT-345]RRD39198.1 PTS ascorbate transporter subunit IIC [Leptotrichia sp. OH3620_COT-345]